MNKKTLERLLNNACELLTELECYADTDQSQKIDALFDEIKYADEIDAEMNKDADAEAQDWDTFGDSKI